MDSDIDNKYNVPFNDCKGDCKTPIGCTCNANDDEESIEQQVTIVREQETTVVAEPPKMGCCKNNGGCCKKNGCCCMNGNKLQVYDWLQDIPDTSQEAQMVEVQFKNTRKGYYLNSNNIELYRGDIVAVEATPGHDIGEVTLTGKLVKLQMLKTNYRGETKRIYRIAKPTDIEKYEEAKTKEHKTMLRAREIAEELGLNMKISDVEYQGDGNKAIFYYIADERVDFRQLIKVYASEFRVKIEMKQIGARQEAGRVGGIGPCGRELCCSSSMCNFVSVCTSAARLQDIPLNPQKLAGQCGKLKCCLNFETDTYVEAQRSLPSRDIPIETQDGTFYHFKTDILSGKMTYSTSKDFAANLVTLDKDRVFEVMRMNKRGKRPEHLEPETAQAEEQTSHDVLEHESISRFDNTDNDRRNGRNKKKKLNKPADNAKDQLTGPKVINKPVRQEGEKEKNRNRSKESPQRPLRNEPANAAGNVQNGESEGQFKKGRNNNRNRNNRNRNNRNNRQANDERNASPQQEV